jgi:DNA polymerase
VLTERQQHCLHGIGITAWQIRSSISARTEVDEPVAEQFIQPSDIEIPSAEEKTKPVEKIQSQVFDLTGWPQMLEAIEACKMCELAKSCTRKVPGKGQQQADLMIIGEAPGHDEDLQGIPFVGRAGHLLDKVLNAINLDSNNVYITNILKCRPPNNRDPHADEVLACSQFLQAQIKLIQPKVILSVGRISAQNLLKDHSPLGRLRDKEHVLPGTNLPLLVTYHPAYLLRNPAEKAKVWHDMKALLRLLNNE